MPESENMCQFSIVMAVIVTVLLNSTPLFAQDAVSGEIAQRRVDSAHEVNNGTNPTLLTTKAGIQYEYYRINSDLNYGVWEAYYSVPFGTKKNMALEFTVPYQSGPVDQSYDLGDVSLKFTHVLDVNSSRGLAYTAKLFFDTAARPDLGNGQAALELSAFYAKFLKGGSIFAPALVQRVGFGDDDPSTPQINVTTIDFYYVPKLSNPKYFMTFDPALTYNWVTEKSFASLKVTMGMLTGKAFGGDSQIFIKPGIYVGQDRPLDFSVQVGYKVLSF